MAELPPQQKLILERLKQGPLSCSDVEGLCKTKESLKVQVHKLKALGYKIATTDPSRKGGSGRKPGEYVLEPDADAG